MFSRENGGLDYEFTGCNAVLDLATIITPLKYNFLHKYLLLVLF